VILLRRTLILALTLLIATCIAFAQEQAAVDAVAPLRLTVTTASGSADLAYFGGAELTVAQPTVVRVIVVFHGLHRNALGYMHDVEEARQMAGTAGRGTLIVAPQFLNEEDAATHRLSALTLRWHRARWEAGDAAVAPAPISSYDAIDAILAQLSNRSLFPNLRQVVLAGHSGGGQIVQRYAVVGRNVEATQKLGITVQFVAANPSSYVYFDEHRPAPSKARKCEEFNYWKYGLLAAPAYVGRLSPQALEDVYMARTVTYLLGTDDDDPNGPDIDKHCAAEAQGPTRLRRGLAYYHYLCKRHPSATTHRVLLVPGVNHNARKMFTSECGIDALFNTGTCKAATLK
jgi:pimeloyl-ACP methyl ester carboxylesterase